MKKDIENEKEELQEEIKELEKEIVKQKKSKPLLIAFLVTLMLGAGVLGGFLGVKYAKHEEAKKNTKEVKETTPAKEEENKKNEVIVLKPSDAKVEKAFSLINFGYEGLPILNEIYSGKNLDLLKLSDNLKFGWTLNIMNRDIDIPTCDPDADIRIADSKIRDYSVFEDVSFVNRIKSSVKFEYGNSGSFVFKYDEEESKFIVYSDNCDGYGPGPTPFYLTEIDSATQKNNILTLNIKFAYYTLDKYIEENEEFTYTAHETFSEEGKVLKRGISDTEKLTDAYAKYQLTYKVVDDKVYPLTIKKV